MKIYTRTGDRGNTSLVNSGSQRVRKDIPSIEAYGTIDELNSWVGLIQAAWVQPTTIPVRETLTDIQRQLFAIGSILAVDVTRPISFSLPKVENAAIVHLEKEIDAMETMLPPLCHFILPAGHLEVCHIHVCRTVCRRAERWSVSLKEQRNEDYFIVIAYLNRLSDYLFVLARYKAKLLGIEETLWKYQSPTSANHKHT